MKTEKSGVRQGALPIASHDNVANGALPESSHDSQGVIDQVRELLFGETKRTTEHGLRALEDKVEALTATMMARFSEVEGRMSDLNQEGERSQAAAIDEIGSAISQLGASIRNMSGARKGK